METNNRNNALQKSSYIALVEKVYSENNKPQRYNGSIESMLREFFSKTSKKRSVWKRETLRQLLIHLYDQRCFAILKYYNFVAVLHNISVFGNALVRPVEDWKPESQHINEQLSSLIKHCFARYETPEFLERSFYGFDHKHMLWYVQLGRGKSVKHLSNLPIKLTDKIAHEFRNAPASLTVNGALRYAQAISFNASPATAKRIAFSRLSNIEDAHEKFWVTVVQFFAKEDNLQSNDINEILDYLNFRYRQDVSLSMKHRTFNALKVQSEEWHRQVYLNEKREYTSWESTGIVPLYAEETEDDRRVIYKTVELLNSKDLHEEGFEMQHCVSEYDEDCIGGSCSIFSLRRYVDGEPVKRLATLEVELPSQLIVQAKAKYNQEPDKKSQELIDQWVSDANLCSRSDKGSNRAYQVQQGAYARALGRRQGRENENTDSAILIMKIVFWLLYFIFRVMIS